MSAIDDSLRKRIVILSGMTLLRTISFFIIASLAFMAVAAPVIAQESAADAASLQKKANDAQERIQANKDDRDQLLIAVKTNEVPLAKQVLLKNGFTAEDLENAKVILRTGGAKTDKYEVRISATCCNPKEITIQRSLDYFTK